MSSTSSSTSRLRSRGRALEAAPIGGGIEADEEADEQREEHVARRAERGPRLAEEACGIRQEDAGDLLIGDAPAARAGRLHPHVREPVPDVLQLAGEDAVQLVPFLDDRVAAPGNAHQHHGCGQDADDRETRTATEGKHVLKPARRGIEQGGKEQAAEDHQQRAGRLPRQEGARGQREADQQQPEPRAHAGAVRLGSIVGWRGVGHGVSMPHEYRCGKARTFRGEHRDREAPPARRQ
jgi:hypothetical protein